jgi:hypothetical protein
VKVGVEGGRMLADEIGEVALDAAGAAGAGANLWLAEPEE